MTALVTLTPLIDIDLLITDQDATPAVLTLAPFIVGPQGPPGPGADLSITPDPGIGLDANNLPDGLIEIATDTFNLNSNFPFHKLPPLP